MYTVSIALPDDMEAFRQKYVETLVQIVRTKLSEKELEVLMEKLDEMDTEGL